MTDDRATGVVAAARRWGAEQMRWAIINKLSKVGTFLGDDLQTVLALIHSIPVPEPEAEEGP